MLEVYPFIKSIHMTTAFISIGLFILRSTMKLRNDQQRFSGWLRYAPHLNDSLLLGCAIFLVIATRQYPFATDWVTVKLFAVVIYILLGMVVMRFARNQWQRFIAFCAALLTFTYILFIAFSRQLSPF